MAWFLWQDNTWNGWIIWYIDDRDRWLRNFVHGNLRHVGHRIADAGSCRHTVSVRSLRSTPRRPCLHLLHNDFLWLPVLLKADNGPARFVTDNSRPWQLRTVILPLLARRSTDVIAANLLTIFRWRTFRLYLIRGMISSTRWCWRQRLIRHIPRLLRLTRRIPLNLHTMRHSRAQNRFRVRPLKLLSLHPHSCKWILSNMCRLRRRTDLWRIDNGVLDR